MTQTTTIVKMLGGEKALGHKVSSAGELIPIVRSGLRYESLEAVINALNLSRDEVTKSIGLSTRTIARRKDEKRLSADESDRLYRLARIAARVEEVLGEMDKANRWLQKPNRSLGSVTPLSLLDTDEGSRQVEAVLGRLEHGVFS